MGWDLKYCNNCKKVYAGPEYKCSVCKTPYLTSQYNSDDFDLLEDSEKEAKIAEVFLTSFKSDKKSFKSEYDKADEVLKCKKLLDSGVLTKEEYNNKKKSLLNL